MFVTGIYIYNVLSHLTLQCNVVEIRFNKVMNDVYFTGIYIYNVLSHLTLQCRAANFPGTEITAYWFTCASQSLAPKLP